MRRRETLKLAAAAAMLAAPHIAATQPEKGSLVRIHAKVASLSGDTLQVSTADQGTLSPLTVRFRPNWPFTSRSCGERLRSTPARFT